jgi:hypothetical protein
MLAPSSARASRFWAPSPHPLATIAEALTASVAAATPGAVLRTARQAR